MFSNVVRKNGFFRRFTNTVDLPKMIDWLFHGRSCWRRWREMSTWPLCWRRWSLRVV